MTAPTLDQANLVTFQVKWHLESVALPEEYLSRVISSHLAYYIEPPEEYIEG